MQPTERCLLRHHRTGPMTGSPDPQRLQVQVATRAEHEALSHILAMLLMTLPRPLSPDAECAPFAAAAAAAPPVKQHSMVSGHGTADRCQKLRSLLPDTSSVRAWTCFILSNCACRNDAKCRRQENEENTRASLTGGSSSRGAVPCVHQRDQAQHAVPGSGHAAHGHAGGGAIGQTLEAGSAGLGVGSRGPAT